MDRAGKDVSAEWSMKEWGVSVAAVYTVDRDGLDKLAHLLLAGCGTGVELDVTNTRAAREVARTNQRGGSVYVGWRVYQSQCLGCHGPDAAGMAGEPSVGAHILDLYAYLSARVHGTQGPGRPD